MYMLQFYTCSTELKTFDSTEFSNNLILTTPLTSNVCKSSTILCYHPNCNYKVCKYIFHTFCYLLSMHWF